MLRTSRFLPFATSIVLLPAFLLPAAADPQFLNDEGHIAVVAHDGSLYDSLTPEGIPNTEPRARVVREFIRTHGDYYDFVVIFTNFDFSLGEADAFYTGVRSDDAGIGMEFYDHGDRFGSDSRLQGVIDMGPVSHYRQGLFSLDPADPRFRGTLAILAHEIGHRWLARVGFRDRSGEISSDLLGRDGKHWSYLLDSDASFLYGSRWQPNGDGTYTAAEAMARFSALDLYLMGFVKAEEVPPFLLLRNPDLNPNGYPERGATIEATAETIQIEQIIDVEGPRLPDAVSSRKNFNLAFVFLTQENVIPSTDDLIAVERVRSSFIARFFSLTAGRAYVDTDLLTVNAPEPTVTPDTTLALEWLLGQQEDDGRWEDHPLTSFRETSVVVSALEVLGVQGQERAAGHDWMSLQIPASVDYLSRAVETGLSFPIDLFTPLQNEDGGFGVAGGYRSDPLDTALALSAMTKLGVPATARRGAARFLIATQNDGGGWSPFGGGESDLPTTTRAMAALQEVRGEFVDLEVMQAVQRAAAWLTS